MKRYSAVVIVQGTAQQVEIDAERHNYSQEMSGFEFFGEGGEFVAFLSRENTVTLCDFDSAQKVKRGRQ